MLLASQLSPQQCTQMPRNGSERPFSPICVHYCVPLRHHGAPARASRRNSVHKWPRTAPRGRFRQSVYTIASPPASRAGLAPQQCTQMPRNGSERPFSAIYVHYCVTTGRPRDPRAATVYTNGLERRRKVVFGDLCTLLCPPASPRGARAGLAPQQCTQMAQNGSERPFSPICVHYCVTTGLPRGPRAATVYTNAPKRLREAVFGDLCTLLRHHGPPARPPRRNSVHKCPETAPKDRFRRSVYTIASPPGARATLAAQQCTRSRSP